MHSLTMDKTTRNHNVFTTYSSVKISNTKESLIKPAGLMREVNVIKQDFTIDKDTFMEFNTQGEPWSEKSYQTALQGECYNTLEYIDLVDFLIFRENK